MSPQWKRKELNSQEDEVLRIQDFVSMLMAMLPSGTQTAL
jgi:hypothetical protein